MDFDLLLKNPKECIDNIAQTTGDLPDMGINDYINEIYRENPELIDQIPLVATLGHLQMSVPGSLIRARCVFVQNVNMEYLPLRLLVNGRYYTPIYQNDIPEGGEEPDFRTMGRRTTILVTSIPYISQWLVNELRPDIEPDNPRTSLQELKSADPDTLFEEPFQLCAKFLYDQPDKPCIICDLIGFVDNPTALCQSDIFADEKYFSSIPSFISLATIPVQSLYIPQVPSPEPSYEEVREQLMNFLTVFFEPLQAELLLLWMIGSVKSRKDEVTMGIFSLNLFETTPQVAHFIISLFRFIFTSTIEVSLDVESLNSLTLRPSVENSELRSTPLLAASETRLIINETELDEGNLNVTGTENCRILQKIIGKQILDYYFDGDIFEIFVSYPTLILSQTRSILYDPINPIQAFLPVGEVNQGDINIDENLLLLLRRYIENVRFLDFDLSDEDSEFATNQLKSVKQANPELTENDLHFLMILNKLNCISHGADSLTDEICDHSLEILLATLPYQKK